MTSAWLLPIARRLMERPAAPYHEAAVRAEVEAICNEHELPFRRDRHGNLLIKVKRGRAPRPLVLVAHLDHPGFDITGQLKKGHLRARFLGGVGARYFRPGTRVRLLPGGMGARLGPRPAKAESMDFVLIPEKPLAAQPAFAVWELEDYALRRGRIHGRACDDLIGVAAILATLITAARSGRPAFVVGAITRAEEVGFGGALALAGSREIPTDALVVSLETSRELPPVKQGDGVIVRVGDRSSVFDSQATRFLTEIAGDLAQVKPRFAFQRALMSGGSCEGTVFSEAGFQAAAVCVALGNYHNCGPRGRIAAEYVSRYDAETMVALLVSAATRMSEYALLTGRLKGRLAKLSRETRRRLRWSARELESHA